MAKIDVTLNGVVCNGIRSLGTNVSRFNMLVISKIQHNINNTERMYRIPWQVPIDVSDEQCASISAGKALKIRFTGEPGNLKIASISVLNCPACILDTFVTQDS